jgi:hypothetical protein
MPTATNPTPIKPNPPKNTSRAVISKVLADFVEEADEVEIIGYSSVIFT